MLNRKLDVQAKSGSGGESRGTKAEDWRHWNEMQFIIKYRYQRK